MPAAAVLKRTSLARAESSRDPVAEAALMALEQANGDQTKASKALQDRVEADAKLKAALMDPLVSYACHQAVGMQIRQHRGRVWNAPLTARPSQREQMLSVAVSNLMLFPLPGGKMLGEASRGEVLAAASFYATQAKDMAHKARWLKAVHDGMGEGATVAQAFDEAKLVVLQKAAS